MIPHFLWIVAGCLLGVLLIWLVHLLSNRHTYHQGPKKTIDRIWQLEMAFFYLAISIIILAEVREMVMVFFGEHPSEQFKSFFCVGFIGFIGSAFILLLAKVVDGMFGEE